MSSSMRSSQSGAKKSKPSRWSRGRSVRKKMIRPSPRPQRARASPPVPPRDSMALVRGTSLIEGNRSGPPLGRDRLRVDGARRERRRPFVERYLTRLGERSADDCLRRLVVEDERALVVRDQRRRREVRRELAGEDQNEVLVPSFLH